MTAAEKLAAAADYRARLIRGAQQVSPRVVAAKTCTSP